MRSFIVCILLLVGFVFCLTNCNHVTQFDVPKNPPATTNRMALRLYEHLETYAKAAQRAVRQSKDSEKTKVAIDHYQEMLRSMMEWAKLPEDENSRYIQVNIPSYQLKLIDQGKDILHMKVIVGRPSRPTPTLTSEITTIVFNPTWTVPKTILERDVIPGMQKNPNYLKEHYDMHVYASFDKDAPEIDPTTIDWNKATLNNFKYRVTAPPSDVNPLGRIKFIFQNDEDVYMHDTPAKSIFQTDDLARSSGCIRLEKPMALVEYFYADNSDLNTLLVNEYITSNQTKFIQLKNPMPVYITYIRAWVDENNRVHFAKHIYGDSETEE